jgi:23S rRNA pseudouridine2604 synthase
MTQNKRKDPKKAAKQKTDKGVRINKYLADMGISTRRGADSLINSGKILINGKPAKLGDRVEETDKVSVKAGKEYERLVYYAYNKPVGVVTVGKQPGEKEIKDVAKFPSTVFPIGRLDKDSNGLLIMTNDGRITKKLLDPKYDHEKEYLVELNKRVEHLFMVRLRDGVRLGSGKNIEMTKKAKVRKVGERSFEIVLKEGKNRQIRRMCKAFGYEVNKLTRVRVMNIKLGNLKTNNFRQIKGKELEDFLKNLL